MIEDFIPAGYENRVTRGYLHEILHVPDRTVRQMIEDAVNRGILIVSCDGGYFRRKDERDDKYIKSYMISENHRFKSQSHKNKRLRELWREIHPDEERHIKQIPGQMSLF